MGRFTSIACNFINCMTIKRVKQNERYITKKKNGKEKKKAIIYFQTSGESSPHQYFFSYEWTHKSTALIECCFLKSWGRALPDSTPCSPPMLELPMPHFLSCHALFAHPVHHALWSPHYLAAAFIHMECDSAPSGSAVVMSEPWGGLMAQRLLNEAIPCFSAEWMHSASPHPELTTLQKILANEILTTLLSKIMLKRVVFLWLVFCWTIQIIIYFKKSFIPCFIILRNPQKIAVS